jgi:hypothetical protein
MKPASNRAGMTDLGSRDSYRLQSSHSCQSMPWCRCAAGEASGMTNHATAGSARWSGSHPGARCCVDRRVVSSCCWAQPAWRVLGQRLVATRSLASTLAINATTRAPRWAARALGTVRLSPGALRSPLAAAAPRAARRDVNAPGERAGVSQRSPSTARLPPRSSCDLPRIDASPEYPPSSGCQSSWPDRGRAARTGPVQSATGARGARCGNRE